MPDVTVYIVDDNARVRESLHELLNAAGMSVETFATSEEFLNAYDPACAGCLVLDLRLKNGTNGLDLQDELVRCGATLPIVILTGHGNVSNSVRALKAGAFDFLQKPTPPEVLLERIHSATKASLQARAAAQEYAAIVHRLDRLTPRERAVMEHLVEGKASKEIAGALGVSVRTVEGHRRMIFVKMGVSSATQLVGSVIRASAAPGRAQER